jgi:hypothetical protein
MAAEIATPLHQEFKVKRLDVERKSARAKIRKPTSRRLDSLNK